MPVQMIELEETMMEVSDDLLEASCRLVGLYTYTVLQTCLNCGTP
jgi:hypothetical protein